MIKFFVPGIPKPGGSKTGFYNKKLNRVMMVDASKNTDWKSSVKAFALHVYQGTPLTVPLYLTVEFRMPRPKNHFRTGKNNDRLKDSSPYWHTSKPDMTKLIRALEDALTGVIWRDDAQVVHQVGTKTYSNVPGAFVVIEEASK